MITFFFKIYQLRKYKCLELQATRFFDYLQNSCEILSKVTKQSNIFLIDFQK